MFKLKINETLLTILLTIVATVAVLYIPGALPAAMEILTLKLLYVALLLATIFLLLFFLRGTKWDFWEEIICDHNIAGAIFVGSIVIALAVVIGT